MLGHGYNFQVINVSNLATIKQQYGVPPHLQSCHTAVVDGYVVEGHVPVREVERLLLEKPAIAGIAVPRMPLGSPGMQVPGMAPQSFDVIAFDQQGNTFIFASYSE
jgi:hypothetical protein